MPLFHFLRMNAVWLYRRIFTVMSTPSKKLVPANIRKFPLFLLASFIVSGCTLGIAAARNADPNFILMMLRALNSPVSIVDLLFAILFPFRTFPYY